MLTIDEAVALAIECGSMLYDAKRKDDSQLRYLYRLAVQAPDGAAVECGVYTGGSLACWSAAREGRGLVIAIDNWSSRNRTRFDENVRRLGLSEKLGLWIASQNSWVIPQVILDESRDIAFCFIDSDHGIRGIPRDILVWPNEIMPGGILVFHDYGVWKPTVVVKPIVDAWQHEAQWEDLGQVGAVKAFRRPGGA